MVLIDFISGLPNKDKAKISREIDMLKEFGFSLGMPYIKKLEGTDKFWKIRIKYSTNNYRIFYFHYIDGFFVLLHGIHKKSMKTPVKDIKLAINRINEYINERRMMQMNHDEMKKMLFEKDPDLENEYNDLKPLYDIKRQLIQYRIEKGLSQKQLADIIGTKQSAISRLESGDYNPSVIFLGKIAHALGKEIHISIQ